MRSSLVFHIAVHRFSLDEVGVNNLPLNLNTSNIQILPVSRTSAPTPSESWTLDEKPPARVKTTMHPPAVSKGGSRRRKGRRTVPLQARSRSTMVKNPSSGFEAFRSTACRWWCRASPGVSVENWKCRIKATIRQNLAATTATKKARKAIRRLPFVLVMVRVAPRMGPLDQLVHWPR